MNWERINAVQTLQEYIEKNIGSPMTLPSLARVVGYSPFHTARIFKELTGKTLFEYIRQLRLSKAAILLRDDKTVRVLDVALDFVFDSHEGFTRAFTKEFGVTPKKYSQKPMPIKLFLPNNIRDYYVLLEKQKASNASKVMEDEDMSNNEKINSKTIFVQVVDRPARKAILKRGKIADHYFAYCEEVGCDVWGVLCSVKDALYEPVGMWMPDKFRPKGTSLYVHAVEVALDYDSEIPDGFEIIELPACKMMIFQGEPYNDENFGEEVGAVMSRIDVYDPTIYGFEWAKEEGPRFQLAPMGYRGYIEGRPVRSSKR